MKTLRQKYFELFAANCVNAVDLTRRKNIGYTAGSDDPFKNFREAAVTSSLPNREPVTVSQVILSRMQDKISRYKSLVVSSDNDQVGEKATDTLNDLFVYANILQIWEQLGHPDGEQMYPIEEIDLSQPPTITEKVGQKLIDAFNWAGNLVK